VSARLNGRYGRKPIDPDRDGQDCPVGESKVERSTTSRRTMTQSDSAASPVSHAWVVLTNRSSSSKWIMKPCWSDRAYHRRSSSRPET
jgi:hypothetical protein